MTDDPVAEVESDAIRLRSGRRVEVDAILYGAARWALDNLELPAAS